ncbi:MAG: PEP-CTERM sorting domain-containing protein [Sedimentisphaerales bacterium]|nr:PEP-CTERM sorting domain-containing protein [Sedimentisphaerales bacterium]
MKQTSKTQHLMYALAVLCTLALLPTAVHAEFRVRGELSVGASGATTYNEEYNIAGQESLSGSASVTGTVGDWASGAYYTNLATGSLGTRAYAYGDGDKFSSVGGGAKSTAFAYFYDTLTFYIPSGNYADDLYVSLDGHLDGTIGTYGADSSYYPTAYQTWYFLFSSGLGGNTLYSNGAYPYYESINTDFLLTSKLLSKGEYANDRTVTVRLQASLKSVVSVPSQLYTTEDAWADVDFYSTGKFLSLDTPDGVTWTSESGVFLSDVPAVSPVPEPASMILVSLGLMTSLVKLRRSGNR